MGPIDKYVNFLTKRLQMDRELQMDIKNELKSHLEDKISENMISGMSEEESIDTAVKQFGPREELESQIWKANIGRMRVCSVIKWGLRVTLGPAAIAFTIFHLFTLFLLTASYNTISFSRHEGRGLFLGEISQLAISCMRARQQKNLTENERFIVNANARSLAKRFPNNPVYCANDIVTHLANKSKIRDKNSSEFSEMFSKLNRGESLEPENSFYNYLKASILMSASSDFEKNTDSKYEVINKDGTAKEVSIYKLIVNDREMFKKGVDEYLKGNAKPYYDSYVFDMAEEKLKILPPPSTVAEQMHSISVLADTPLPHLSRYRDMARRVPPYAELLFEEGNKSSALAILKDIEKPYLKIAENSRTIIGLLVVRACISITLGNAQKIYDKMNMPEEASKVRAKAKEDNLFFNSLWSDKYRRFPEDDVMKHGGILNAMLFRSLPGIEISFSPMRTVEKITAESGGLELLLAAFSVLLITLGIITTRNMWKYRKKEGGPMLYFIGWGRLFKMTFISMVLPIGIYLTFTRAFPFSGRNYGLSYGPYAGRFGLQVLLGITLIFWLVLIMGFSAVRKRCLNAGIKVCGDGHFNLGIGWKIALLILLVIIIAFFVTWERAGEALVFLYHLGFLPVSLVSLVILISIAIFIRQAIIFLRMGAQLRQFKLTAIRSLLPILAFSVLLTGIICHCSLRSVERANIRLMHQPGRRYFADEVEQTSFKYYRDYLREKIQTNR